MVRRFVQRYHADISWFRWLKAGLSAFTAFGIALLLGDITGASMIIAPMAASAVLIYGVPHSPFSQPAHVVGGNCVAAGAALAADHFLPAGPWVLAGAVAAIIALLGVLRLSHPPAAATAFGVMLTHPSWNFLITPVFSSSVTLVLVAVLMHQLPPKATYPL
jgi:CBS-domain-containing membrane protein